MLGYAHNRQPTVILRRKSECLDMCTDAPPTMILHSIKICNICIVCNFMRTSLFLEVISLAKINSVFFLQNWFWNLLTTYICNYFREWYSEHREDRSSLGKLQWLQLQSHPDLSYEVNRAAQRSSAPTVADARALDAISLKAQRSSKTTLRYPRGVINVSSAQLVTYGDASFANMEGSKSQCGVIVFVTHESRRFWHGEFQLGHLVYWTSSTIKRVVRSTLAAEAYSVSEAVEEAQWLRSVRAEMWPSFPSSLPRSLITVEMDSLRRPNVTLSDSFNLCQAVKSDKGTGSDKRLRIVTAMLRQVFCGAQGATLAFVRTATMLADALTKALAEMNARRHVFVTSESSIGVKTTLPMSSEPMPTLKMAIASQLIRSAESHSGSSGPCTN